MPPITESESEAQSCLTLCNPMDCSLSRSSVHGIFQARVLEWIAISFSRGSSRPRNRTRVSGIAGRHFTVWATREAHYLGCNQIPNQSSKKIRDHSNFTGEQKEAERWETCWSLCQLDSDLLTPKPISLLSSARPQPPDERMGEPVLGVGRNTATSSLFTDLISDAGPWRHMGTRSAHMSPCLE